MLCKTRWNSRPVPLVLQGRDQPPVPEPNEQEKKGLVRSRPESMQSYVALPASRGASQHVSLRLLH